MIEVSIFTVVVAHPDAPSVVVLTEKGSVPSALDALDANPGSLSSLGAFDALKTANAPGVSGAAGDTGGATVNGRAGATDVAEDSTPSDHQTNALENTSEPQLLPIWIGHSEAEAILLLLEDQPHTRPYTHDLLANVIGALGSRVERVVIDKVMGATFFANICLDREGRMIHIDARPSDSIALALRTGARIFVDEDVMNAAARQFRVKVSDGGELLYGSEDEMERFHSFIESVSPEDFSL